MKMEQDSNLDRQDDDNCLLRSCDQTITGRMVSYATALNTLQVSDQLISSKSKCLKFLRTWDQGLGRNKTGSDQLLVLHRQYYTWLCFALFIYNPPASEASRGVN